MKTLAAPSCLAPAFRWRRTGGTLTGKQGDYEASIIAHEDMYHGMFRHLNRVQMRTSNVSLEVTKSKIAEAIAMCRRRFSD